MKVAVSDLAVGDRFLWLDRPLTITHIDYKPSGRTRRRKSYTLWVSGIDWDYLHYYGDELVEKVA